MSCVHFTRLLGYLDITWQSFKIWEFWGEFWGIETFHRSKFSPATGVTPVTGSIFLPLSRTQNLRSEFRFSISQDFKFCFTWYPTEITLCLWSGFISPRIRTFVEKSFSLSLFRKEGFEIWGCSFVSELELTFSTQCYLFPILKCLFLKCQGNSIP